MVSRFLWARWACTYLEVSPTRSTPPSTASLDRSESRVQRNTRSATCASGTRDHHVREALQPPSLLLPSASVVPSSLVAIAPPSTALPRRVRLRPYLHLSRTEAVPLVSTWPAVDHRFTFPTRGTPRPRPLETVNLSIPRFSPSPSASLLGVILSGPLVSWRVPFPKTLAAYVRHVLPSWCSCQCSTTFGTSWSSPIRSTTCSAWSFVPSLSSVRC